MSNSSKVPVAIDISAYKKLFAKLMHSFAIQSNCSVIYNKDTQQIIYQGPPANVDYVINETAKLLNIQPQKFKKILLKGDLNDCKRIPNVIWYK